MYSPICLFTYNRLDLTKRTVEELQKNYLAPESNLIIFSDGPKTPESSKQVMDLRKYLKTIEGFLSVEIYESPRNKGLADSIISGVSSVVEKYGKAIVLEDDLLTTPNFLSYMNQAMEYYENSKEIISICGYGLKIKKPYYYKEDVYLYGRSFSWGWATWVDRWETIDWEVKDWESFKYDKKMV
jgi:GT2 family glycosyltransferase